MITKTKDRPSSPVRKAFGVAETIELENGSSIRLRKWSVSKAIAMGNSLLELGNECFKIAAEQQKVLYDEAIAKAESKSLSEDDDLFPKPSDFQNIGAGDLLKVLPNLAVQSSSRLAKIVHESLRLGKEGVPQATMEEILGETDTDKDWTFEDFIEVTATLIEMNVTDALVKKVKRLFNAGQIVLKTITSKKEKDPGTQ